MAEPKIVIFGTGGTIAGRAASRADSVGYQAAQIGIDQLLQDVPQLQQLAGCRLEAVQLAQIDSKDMDWTVWRLLLLRVQQALAAPDIQAVVITHGTDTLEETAWLLDALLRPAKPVVLTCAMRPATALQADGPQNLCDAVSVAACGGRPGIWVVAAGAVHAAGQVQKVHPYRLDALHSYEGGPVAYVQEGQVRWLGGLPAAQPLGERESALRLARLQALRELPWVEIVNSAALQSGRAIEALATGGVQGLVIAGTGNATVHRDLLPAALRVRRQGVWVWAATRCLEGLPVLAANALPAQEGAQAREAEWLARWCVRSTDPERLDAVMLPPAKARVAMMLGLALACATPDTAAQRQ